MKRNGAEALVEALHGVSREMAALREQISHKFAMLSGQLQERLDDGQSPLPARAPSPLVGRAAPAGVPLPEHEAVRRAVRARQLRIRYIPAEFAVDPAWDMLLDLYSAEIEQRKVSVTSLSIASGVPATTALRWIRSMVDAGLFKRSDDFHDRRRSIITLSASASEAMTRYFHALGDATLA